MKIPTKPELNGRVLYTVIAENTAEKTLYVRYVGTDYDEAVRRSKQTPLAPVLGSMITYDAREMDQE